MRRQAELLVKKPHVVVATPGRLADLLRSNSDQISFKKIKFLILDEADRLLEPAFEEDLSFILQSLADDRQTLLFSATMTTKLEKLQAVALNSPFVYHADPK